MKKTLFFLLLLPSLAYAKVYDCFLFFNEFEILKIRLAELDEVVDHFVLVESLETFQGNPKPLYFEENKELFAPYLDKIIHVVVERHPEFDNPWPRERYQRDAIGRALKNCERKDVILVSDCDEIPSAKFVKTVASQIKESPKKLFVARMPLFRYHLNRFASYNWSGTVGSSFYLFAHFGADRFRYLSHRKDKIIFLDEGWHFTSMGGYDAVYEKIHSFSHAECIPIIDELFQMGIQEGTLLPIDNSFPKYIQDNQEYLESIGYIEPVD